MLVHVPSVTIWGTKIGINNMQSIRLFKPQLNKKFKEVRWFANPSLQVGGRDRGRARHEGGKIVPYTYIYIIWGRERRREGCFTAILEMNPSLSTRY